MMREIRTGENTYMKFDDEKHTVYESVEKWREEGKRRFGEDVRKWKFRCPMCGHVASVQEFEDAGAEDAMNDAYQECIGRYTGKGSPVKGDSSGCNWAAYGFLRIPNGKGVTVITGEGTGTEVFPFADDESGEK